MTFVARIDSFPIPRENDNERFVSEILLSRTPVILAKELDISTKILIIHP